MNLITDVRQVVEEEWYRCLVCECEFRSDLNDPLGDARARAREHLWNAHLQRMVSKYVVKYEPIE